jgi:hypothetical protein
MSPAMVFDAVPQLLASCIEHEVIGQSAVFEFLKKSFHDVKLGIGVTACCAPITYGSKILEGKAGVEKVVIEQSAN